MRVIVIIVRVIIPFNLVGEIMVHSMYQKKQRISTFIVEIEVGRVFVDLFVFDLELEEKMNLLQG